jgi:hypothetical protein
VRYAGRLGGGQQVIGSLGAQPGGADGPPVEVLQVGFAGVSQGDPGHLVHDHVRPGGRHRFTDGHRVQSVHHDAVRAQLFRQSEFCRARRRGRHLVTSSHELRHQPPPQDPDPARHENPHAHHLPDSEVCLRPSGRDSPAVL